MASGLNTTQAVDEAVARYVANHYPMLRCSDLSRLKLDETWLVQAAIGTGDASQPTERLVLLVNRYGWVEEVGGPATRQSAQRGLAAMKSKVLTQSRP